MDLDDTLLQKAKDPDNSADLCDMMETGHGPVLCKHLCVCIQG